MLKVDRLDASIGPTPILRAIDLEVSAGSMCGLIGRNGAVQCCDECALVLTSNELSFRAGPRRRRWTWRSGKRRC